MIEEFKLVRLNENSQLKAFNCNDSDLNDFFINDSIPHLKSLMSVTYTIESDSKTIAFFSLLNDKISSEEAGSKVLFNKLILKKLPNRKRFRSVPAIKIGRLGVHVDYWGNDFGTMILDYIKQTFITNNRTGCRFVTVDAYKESLGFYEKNGFKYLTDKDSNEDTRLMFCDLNTKVK